MLPRSSAPEPPLPVVLAGRHLHQCPPSVTETVLNVTGIGFYIKIWEIQQELIASPNVVQKKCIFQNTRIIWHCVLSQRNFGHMNQLRILNISILLARQPNPAAPTLEVHWTASASKKFSPQKIPEILLKLPGFLLL